MVWIIYQSFVGLIKWFQAVFNSGSCLMVNHGTVGLLGHAANNLPPHPGPNCCWRFPRIAWFGPARHKEGGATWYQRVWPGLVYLTFQEVRTYENNFCHPGTWCIILFIVIMVYTSSLGGGLGAQVSCSHFVEPRAPPLLIESDHCWWQHHQHRCQEVSASGDTNDSLDDATQQS